MNQGVWKSHHLVRWKQVFPEGYMIRETSSNNQGQGDKKTGELASHWQHKGEQNYRRVREGSQRTSEGKQCGTENIACQHW